MKKLKYATLEACQKCFAFRFIWKTSMEIPYKMTTKTVYVPYLGLSQQAPILIHLYVSF